MPPYVLPYFSVSVFDPNVFCLMLLFSASLCCRDCVGSFSVQGVV